MVESFHQSPSGLIYYIGNGNCVSEKEIELVEEKGIGEKIGNLIDGALKENPILTGMFTNALKEKDTQIEKLQAELRNKQSKIDWLEGQISVYEKVLNNKEEN